MAKQPKLDGKMSTESLEAANKILGDIMVLQKNFGGLTDYVNEVVKALELRIEIIDSIAFALVSLHGVDGLEFTDEKNLAAKESIETIRTLQDEYRKTLIARAKAEKKKELKDGKAKHN